MTAGQIIGWLVMGLIVGFLARLIVPGPHPMGILMTIVLGIIGAIVGGVLYNLIAHGTAIPAGGYNVETAWQGWLFSIIGGILVLWVYVAIARRSGT